MLVTMRALLALALVGSLAACDSGGDATPRSTPGGAGRPPVTTPTAARAASLPPCQLGTFRITSISSKRGATTALGDVKITASGGGLTLTLNPDGRWLLQATGTQPLTLTAGTLSAQGIARGDVRGTYAQSGDKLGFDVDQASGTVTVSYGGQTADVPMDDFAAALAPTGVATVTCGATDVRLSSDNVDLTLVRGTVGGR